MKFQPVGPVHHLLKHVRQIILERVFRFVVSFYRIQSHDTMLSLYSPASFFYDFEGLVNDIKVSVKSSIFAQRNIYVNLIAAACQRSKYQQIAFVIYV